MGDNRIFGHIRERYEHFFRYSPKVNSARGKNSKIIKPEMYEAYLTTVFGDKDIDSETKALVALLTTGLRITEVLFLKNAQVNCDAHRVERALILKKRNKDLRLTKPLHPIASAYLREYLKGKTGEELALSFGSRHQPFRRLERYFGTGCHDYRHSFIAYFLAKNNNQGLEKITAIQGWSSVAMAYTYSNVDTTKEVDDFFKNAA